jgi:hypothetical protein
VFELGVQLTGVTSADAHDDLANVDTGNSAIGLAPGTSHPRLQTIGTGARQHLVDADDMVRVGPDTEVETFLASNLDQVLVGTDTGSFEGLRAQLLILVRDKVDAEREVVDVRPLPAEIEDSDLGVGHTTVEPRLGIRLRRGLAAVSMSCSIQPRPHLVLAVSVATGRSSSHCSGCFLLSVLYLVVREEESGFAGVFEDLKCSRCDLGNGNGGVDFKARLPW